MIECKIIKCLDNNEYAIKCGEDVHNLVLEFYGMENPIVGDELIINEILLDNNWENFSQPYAFEKIAINPLNVSKLHNNDLIILKTKDKLCTLKRIYG